MDAAPLRLKQNMDRRLRAGHCWIYSNEVDTAATPLQGFAPGQSVELINHQGRWLGSGYVNPNSLICARLVSRDRAHPLNTSLLVHRINIALSLRERLFAAPYYRLVFGESDGLPGLVVDRFGEHLVIQLTTAGMELLRDEVVAAVDKVLKPGSILLRNDSPARKTEGLPLYVESALGAQPDVLEIVEHGMRFQAPAQGGQKTGWFFDQAANRKRMHPYAKGARVLDVCSYLGAWGVQAAVHGAAEVYCVDASAAALDGVEINAALNGVGEKMVCVQGDAFDALRELRAAHEQFDLVLVDPPAFVKRRKDLKTGTLAYRRLNQQALQLLSRDGMLITSSCSHHMSGESLLEQVQQVARHTDRSLQLLEQGYQGVDHPIHPAMPETAYLKSFTLRVLPSF